MVLTVYSPVFAFACMAIFIAFVSLPIFKAADASPTNAGRRLATIDGLRGILAISVFFHHATINYAFQKTGIWTVPPSAFYTMLGQAGVALFFMVTGFLFWQKMLVERGRPRWLQLFIGRVFRIGPLYLAFVACMVILVFAKSHWHFQGTVFGFVKSLAWWLPLGALGPGQDLNHLPGSSVSIAGATWSLQYEWAFYGSLLPLALFARNRIVSLVACLGGGTALLTSVVLFARPSVVASPLVCSATFLAGMSVAAVQNVAAPIALPPAFLSTVVVALALAMLTLFSSAHGAAAIIVLAVLFALVASGCDVFGGLVARSILRLGDMSYSLYLLHGIVLSAFFSVDVFKRYALASPERYWSLVALCGLVLIALSTASLVAIERSGVALGRAFGRKVAVSPEGSRFATGIEAKQPADVR